MFPGWVDPLPLVPHLSPTKVPRVTERTYHVVDVDTLSLFFLCVLLPLLVTVVAARVRWIDVCSSFKSNLGM